MSTGTWAGSATLAALAELCEDGMVDAVIGGPPCSTFSRARHRPGGPRPVRLRGRWIWGLPGLADWEKRRVEEANVLIFNLMTLAEACHRCGGSFLFEHPQDPGREPYASLWSTNEMQQLEARTGAVRTLIDQCMLGGKAPSTS